MIAFSFIFKIFKKYILPLFLFMPYLTKKIIIVFNIILTN